MCFYNLSSNCFIVGFCKDFWEEYKSKDSSYRLAAFMVHLVHMHDRRGRDIGIFKEIVCEIRM